MDKQKKQYICNTAIWSISIPICIAAIYFFYQGVMYSLMLGMEEIEQSTVDYNFGGFIIIFGWLLITIVSMCIINLIVHSFAGYKILNQIVKQFSWKQLLLHRTDSKKIRRIKLLSYFFLLVHTFFIIRGMYQSNYAYILWGILALIMTIFYEWCFVSENYQILLVTD